LLNFFFFCQSWQSRPNVVRFHSISIGADTVSAVDFFREADTQSQRRASTAGLPPPSVVHQASIGQRKISADTTNAARQEQADAEARCIVFRHRTRKDARIRYRFENG
jgi:hypothetical protein